MPTTRARYTVTETEQVARALDEAAAHWPEAAGARGQLLLHLVEEGYRAIREAREERVAQRRAAIRRTEGILTGAFPDGYLARLRDEWPA